MCGNRSTLNGFVPNRSHYDAEYVGATRVFSYAHVLAAVNTLHPRTVLEIGVGTGIVSDALRRLGIAVTTVDVEPSVCPDVLADVRRMPFEDQSFDVAVCCQVLEHLPFEDFGDALRELRRVTRGQLVLSLPDQDRYFELTVRLPKLGCRTVAWSLPRLRPRPLPPARFAEMGHHWEIGVRGTPRRRVLGTIIAAGSRVQRTWRVPELPWHRFFVLERVGNG